MHNAGRIQWKWQRVEEAEEEGEEGLAEVEEGLAEEVEDLEEVVVVLGDLAKVRLEVWAWAWAWAWVCHQWEEARRQCDQHGKMEVVRPWECHLAPWVKILTALVSSRYWSILYRK